MALTAAKILGVLFVLCAMSPCSFASGNNTSITDATPTPMKYNTTYLPTIYVKIELDMTWTEFCMLDGVFKHKIGSLVFDKNSMAIGPKRVIIHNYQEYCTKSTKNKYKKANLELYITKQDDGHQEDVDIMLTQQTYEKLDYIVKSMNQWELGRVFKGQVKKVSIGGKDASPLTDKVSEFAHTWIAIAIATAILIAIIIILVIISLVKKPKKPANETVHFQPNNPEHGATINPTVQPEYGEPSQPSQLSDNYASSTKL